MPSNEAPPKLLGPFVGHTTASSCRLWLHREHGPEKAYAHVGVWNKAESETEAWTRVPEPFVFERARLFCATVDIDGLSPDTIYSYKITHDEAGLERIDLDGLDPDDLYFRTMPADDAIADGRIDFLLMSCHNPDKGGGYQVWEALRQILPVSSRSDKTGGWVRFAILGGDQLYADAWESRLLDAKTREQRLALYLEAYRHFWSHPAYRKILCRLPAYLMWDDHDITDGWGSREDSFEAPNSPQFTEPWIGLFDAAKTSFAHFQATRNPALAGSPGFDSCFRIGNAAFVLADLRSFRNKRKKQIWAPDQFAAIKAWISAQHADRKLETIFFLSPVVFSHDDPKTISRTYRIWARILCYFQDLSATYHRSRVLYNLRAVLVGLLFFLLLVFPVVFFAAALAGILYASFKWGLKLLPLPYSTVESFMREVGDLRDDIDDAWSSELNRDNAEEVLSWFFDLQNRGDDEDTPQVVILSGDIHAAGYSTLHSHDADHQQNPVIPHIVSSPVGYAPFSWVMEAIFRANTRDVPLGTSKRFFAQISHHFTSRNVAILSIRDSPKSAGKLLKVKYYVEGFPEPQIVVFDLQKASHLETIKWPARPVKS